MKSCFKTPAAAIALLLVFLLTGCGYHIAGKGGEFPGGITELAIPVFKNNTYKPEVESVMTSAFASEFITSIEVSSKAQAVMLGEITSYERKPVSYSKSDVNQEYRLTVKLSLQLVRYTGENAEPEVLWSDANVTDYEDYTVNTSSVTATEDAEAAALVKIAEDTARTVKERILDRF